MIFDEIDISLNLLQILSGVIWRSLKRLFYSIKDRIDNGSCHTNNAIHKDKLGAAGVYIWNWLAL